MIFLSHDQVSDSYSYIDEVWALSTSWDDHVKIRCIIIYHLHSNVFTVNPFKHEWSIKEPDWFSYWLTPDGLKPWKKNSEFNPTNWSFAHLYLPLSFYWLYFNYYCNMRGRHWHVFKPNIDCLGMKKGHPLTKCNTMLWTKCNN